MKILDFPIGSALSASPRTPLVFATAEDKAEFYSYPPEEQESIRTLHHAMTLIAAAPNPHQGCKTVSTRMRIYKAGYLRTLFDAWQAADQDWRELVDVRRFPRQREPELPEAMQAYIRAKFSANQRKCRPAYMRIIAQWKSWMRTGDRRHALPGYETCPPPAANGRHPVGMSLKTCMRYAPPLAELQLARIGVHAAMMTLPHIPGTREGARWLEFVSGDDVWLDRQVMVPPYGPRRVLQFGMMDFAASFYLDRFVQRPEIPRADGTSEGLKRRDYLWTVALMLEHYGVPTDYQMHIICERGTATMTRAEARYLYEVSEGRIVTCWSTMEGEMVAAWDERKSGNSRAKSWHESFHNLLHNYSADIAGQVGKDRQHSPAELMGRERSALALQNAALQLPKSERDRLRFPFPTLQHCYAQTMERIAFINDREEHDCEGFETVMDWRPRGLQVLPQPEAALPQWLAANPRADINTDVEWFPRVETPRERMLKLSAQSPVMRLPESVWRRFYEDLHETRRIADDGSFAFERKIDGVKRVFRFVPPTVEEALRPGTEVTGFFRPDGSAIHLFSGGDRYLLSWPAEKKVRRGDSAALAEAMGRKRGFLNQALANVREARADEIEQAKLDELSNEAVLVENGVIEAPGNGTLSLVQERCTPAAAAVQAVISERERADRAAEAVRQVNVVKETLKRPETEAAPSPADKWL